MSHEDQTVATEPGRSVPVDYERPRVERVLTPAELEREVLFARQPTTPFTYSYRPRGEP